MKKQAFPDFCFLWLSAAYFNFDFLCVCRGKIKIGTEYVMPFFQVLSLSRSLYFPPWNHPTACRWSPLLPPWTPTTYSCWRHRTPCSCGGAWGPRRRRWPVPNMSPASWEEAQLRWRRAKSLVGGSWETDRQMATYGIKQKSRKCYCWFKHYWLNNEHRYLSRTEMTEDWVKWTLNSAVFDTDTVVSQHNDVTK